MTGLIVRVVAQGSYWSHSTAMQYKKVYCSLLHRGPAGLILQNCCSTAAVQDSTKNTIFQWVGDLVLILNPSNKAI